MGIRFACHVCNKKLNIKRELAGRRGVCPSCTARFRIPLEDAETSTPVEAVRKIQVQREAIHDQAVSTSAAADMLGDLESTLVDDDTEATWYVRPPSGGQYGPATAEVLKQWIAEGRVAATALLWREGWPQWRDADKVLPDLAGQLPSGGVSRNSDSAVVGTSTSVISTETEEKPSSMLQRPKVKQRIRLIGVLAVLAVLLIGVLLFVMIQTS